jgi:hypothetical protein
MIKIRLFFNIKNLEKYVNSFPKEIIKREIRIIETKNYICFFLIIDY